MKNLDLSAEGEAAALVSLLTRIIADDRYPLLPRIHTLKAILSELRPEPAHQLLPPPKVYPPSKASAAAVGAPRKDRRHRDRREVRVSKNVIPKNGIGPLKRAIAAREKRGTGGRVLIACRRPGAATHSASKTQTTNRSAVSPTKSQGSS